MGWGCTRATNWPSARLKPAQGCVRCQEGAFGRGTYVGV